MFTMRRTYQLTRPLNEGCEEEPLNFHSYIRAYVIMLRKLHVNLKMCAF